MTKAEIRTRRLARAIADDLFVNGHGDVAGRLELVVDGPARVYLGGWSKRAVIERVMQQLARALGGQE